MPGDSGYGGLDQVPVPNTVSDDLWRSLLYTALGKAKKTGVPWFTRSYQQQMKAEEN